MQNEETGATNRWQYQSNWLSLKDSNHEIILSPSRLYSTSTGQFLQKDFLFPMTLLKQQGKYRTSIFRSRHRNIFGVDNYGLYRAFKANPVRYVDVRGLDDEKKPHGELGKVTTGTIPENWNIPDESTGKVRTGTIPENWNIDYEEEDSSDGSAETIPDNWNISDEQDNDKSKVTTGTIPDNWNIEKTPQAPVVKRGSGLSPTIISIDIDSKFLKCLAKCLGEHYPSLIGGALLIAPSLPIANYDWVFQILDKHKGGKKGKKFPIFSIFKRNKGTDSGATSFYRFASEFISEITVMGNKSFKIRMPTPLEVLTALKNEKAWKKIFFDTQKKKVFYGRLLGWLMGPFGTFAAATPASCCLYICMNKE